MYEDQINVSPSFEIDNETSLMEEPIEYTLEHNIIVSIPPKRRYSVQMNVTSIRKGVPDNHNKTNSADTKPRR